jgi:hypothetical protein
MPERDWSAFRQLLQELLHDPVTRRLIEQRTDIAWRTLTRWISGETEAPDRKRLLALLQALPQHREALLAAIAPVMPEIEVSLIDTTESLLEELPLEFWLRLLEANANTPKNLHFATLVHLIFLQLQTVVDPEHRGVQLIIAQCSPPVSFGQPIRSLREVMKMTTHQSLLMRPGDTSFLGAESLCGYCVSLCQASIVQNTHLEQGLPVRRSPDEQSAAAYPIQRGGYVAGCLLVSSPQPNFFSQRLQYLLHIYAYVLSLAFETDQFYPPEQIRLRPMPPESLQQHHIATFGRQVLQFLQRDPSLSRAEAERLAWQQIEEALLAQRLD